MYFSPRDLDFFLLNFENHSLHDPCSTLHIDSCKDMPKRPGPQLVLNYRCRVSHLPLKYSCMVQSSDKDLVAASYHKHPQEFNHKKYFSYP